MDIDPQTRLQLINNDMTLEEALENEDNILQALDYPQQRLDLCTYLLEHRETLPAIVAHHLNIDIHLCDIAAVEHWLHGSFNLCIPILVNDIPTVMFRIPLPYKIGESEFPGNADEKLRCEAATYIYLQENCPDIPIPTLWGFGVSNGLAFTTLENGSIFLRSIRYLYDRILSIFRCPVPAPYFRNDIYTDLGLGYLLLDYIDDGQMLSKTFKTQKENKELQLNLFTDLSRILLSLGKIPQPRIGSFTINDHGMITLSNRPLTCRLHILENERIPTHIDRKTTYSSVGGYVSDLLGCHDNRLLYQPNSINDEDDGRMQMAALSLMRSVSPHVINPETCNGPFILTLTDTHISNIFVDKNWHIKAFCDLEWACSLPSEMQQPPYWITGEALDALNDEKLDKFIETRDKFVSIFEHEERVYTQNNQVPRTCMMQTNWRTGSFWYFEALQTTKGLYNIFRNNLQSRFSNEFPYKEISHFWRENTDKIIQAKLSDRKLYCESLIQRAKMRTA